MLFSCKALFHKRNIYYCPQVLARIQKSPKLSSCFELLSLPDFSLPICSSVYLNVWHVRPALPHPFSHSIFVFFFAVTKADLQNAKHCREKFHDEPEIYSFRNTRQNRETLKNVFYFLLSIADTCSCCKRFHLASIWTLWKNLVNFGDCSRP